MTRKHTGLQAFLSSVVLLFGAACGNNPLPGESPTPPRGDYSLTPSLTPAPSVTPTATPPPDADGDGTLDVEDCAAQDQSVYPGADEVCNDRDDDCDTEVDEGAADARPYYPDEDGDGHGSSASPSSEAVCTAPEGYSLTADDCDDEDPGRHPGATEICDRKDNDCNGSVDDGAGTLSYQDSDGDTWGSEVSHVGCEVPEDYVTYTGDCNDDDETAYPEATEVCDGIDNDCNDEIDDEAVDRTPFYQDSDEDGYGAPQTEVLLCGLEQGFVEISGDCNDDDEDIHPEAQEVCDGADNDCDDAVDSGDGLVAPVLYQDWDGDGYGDLLASTSPTCILLDGFVEDSRDCNDSDATIYPGSVELCNAGDDDCDTAIDEDFDQDSDQVTICAGDCNDSSATISPLVAEICNGVDDDCDDIPDDGVLLLWYLDLDGDGYGNDDFPTTSSCNGPSGYAAWDGDCDDSSRVVYPEALETCDDRDNDCDGSTDEDLTSPFYYDADGDGYGWDESVTFECLAPSPGFIEQGGDCDDVDPTAYPGAEDEPFDGVDKSCDGFDGDPSKALHVAPWGQANNPGTADAPLSSVATALELADRGTYTHVLVAEGTYPGGVRLVGGVRLLGGYDPDFTVRDPTLFVTEILNSAPSAALPGALNCFDLGTEYASVDGVVARGLAGSTPGGSAYGLYAVDCTDRLSISDSILVAGTGNGGTTGANGMDGADGRDGANGILPVLVSSSAELPARSPGGTLSCGSVDVSGGSGSGSSWPTYLSYQPSGLAGSPAGSAGAGGTGATDGMKKASSCTTYYLGNSDTQGPGYAGTAGNPGTAGVGGSGATSEAGLSDARIYQGRPGQSGTAGTPGAGGGGGGGGSGCQSDGCGSSNTGGTGAGGGSGGCAGSAGYGGSPGGGSFGAFLVFTRLPSSFPLIVSSEVWSSDGGSGGNGGDGGLGGLSGRGGVGGAEGSGSTWASAAGGDGGDGGRGGDAGGGGGGAGGPSYSIFVWGATPSYRYDQENLLYFGRGGYGGYGGYGARGGNGKTGATGSFGALSW